MVVYSQVQVRVRVNGQIHQLSTIVALCASYRICLNTKTQDNLHLPSANLIIAFAIGKHMNSRLLTRKSQPRLGHKPNPQLLRPPRLPQMDNHKPRQHKIFPYLRLVPWSRWGFRWFDVVGQIGGSDDCYSVWEGVKRGGIEGTTVIVGGEEGEGGHWCLVLGLGLRVGTERGVLRGWEVGETEVGEEGEV